MISISLARRRSFHFTIMFVRLSKFLYQSEWIENLFLTGMQYFFALRELLTVFIQKSYMDGVESDDLVNSHIVVVSNRLPIGVTSILP